MQKELRSILSTEKNQIIIEQDPIYFLNYNYICICMCILKKVRTETDHLETIMSGMGVRNSRGRVKRTWVVILNLLRCLLWCREPHAALLFRAEGGLLAWGCSSGSLCDPCPSHSCLCPPGPRPLNPLLSARIGPHGDRVLPAVSTLMRRGLGLLFFLLKANSWTFSRL